MRERSEWESRFWAKVDRRGPDECWPWVGGYIDPHGYGRLDLTKRQPKLAHRLAYFLAVGEFTGDLDHTCHSRDTECAGGPTCLHRRCVNPAHLEPVTRGENVRRGTARITACPKGHVYDEANTSRRKNGHRLCRRCARDAMRAKRR